MRLQTKETKLESITNGEYPLALREAKSLLVEEQKNFVPMYMDGVSVGILEAQVKEAERDGQAEGNIAAKQASQAIEDFKGSVKRMIRGMRDWGPERFVYGVRLSNDLDSTTPSITQPRNDQFSFEIKPKTFPLGLTGRILEDENKNRFQEFLTLECNIYNAYDLAESLSPERIIAVDYAGNKKIVYESDKIFGQTEQFKNNVSRKMYVLTPEKSWLSEQEVLPTGGLKIIPNEFWEQIKTKYGRAAMMFGHKYSNVKEFLSIVRLTDSHLIWDIASENLGMDGCLVDYEHFYQDINLKHPEYANRLHFMSGKARLSLDNITIYFDKSAGLQALMSLGEDVVRNIWVDPGNRREESWDIVYDALRGITPAKPIKIDSKEESRQYQVLK